MGTYMGLAVPLYGASQITATAVADDVITITGVASQTGDYLVCETSAGVEKFVVDVNGAVTAASTLSVGGSVSLASAIEKMVIGTIALASLASNASATVTLTGLTTADVVSVFNRAAVNEPQPIVWASAADKLGYAAPGVSIAAQTINVWAFATA